MSILNRPLRVMHIISGDLWAGAEVQAYTLLKHLRSEVELCVILMNKGELSEKLISLGISPIIIPETENSSFGITCKLFDHIRQFKPDVIHTHRQKENILGGLANLACVVINGKLIPSLRTAHGAPEFNPKGKQKIQIRLDRWVGRYLQKKVIAVSEDLAKKLISLFPINHIEVIQNGVDLDELKRLAAHPAEFRQLAPSKMHVGIIGRLEPVKRIDLFLEMASLLINQQDIWHFHVIGDGKLKQKLEAQAQQLGIFQSVSFHGHRQDIPSCIAALDVIIMCSDHEGTPMTALEVLALGKPLVAHDVGGLSEMLADYPKQLVQDHSAAGYALSLSQSLSQAPSLLALPKRYTAQENAMKSKQLYNTICTNTQS